MTTAFVLSGGGSLGSVQVGMLRALVAQGVAPDLLVGTSVGALNAAWMATWPDEAGIDALTDLWLRVRREDVSPFHPVGGLLGAIGRRNHLVAPDNLRRLISQNLGLDRLENAKLPVHVIATDVATGLEVVLSRGDATNALLASAAIPGVFPPVRIDDHVLMDGGVANNAPISHAVRLGATTIYVLPTGYACALEAPPRGALGMAVHALTLLMEQRLILDVIRYEGEVDLHVLPPLCPLKVAPTDFSSSRSLIVRAELQSREWLAKDCPPHDQARLLGFHSHAFDEA